MLKSLTLTELQKLAEHQAQPCISLYMPTHRRRPGTQQDRIRFRHLLERARTLLRPAHDEAAIESLLQPLQDLADTTFWLRQQDGLAIFRSPDVDVYFKLPMDVPELALVATTFHTKPLLKYLSNNRRYYVLSLAQNHVTLYEGNQDSLRPLDVPTLPASLQAVLQDDTDNRTSSFSSRAGATQGAIHHGQDPGDEGHKIEIAKYFRAIDKALLTYLHDEQAPLVLAGVDALHAIYRGVGHYPHLVDEGATGNFEREQARRIHEKTWPIAERVFGAAVDKVLATYRDTAGSDQAVDELAAIAKAAAAGRIRSLIIANGQHLWGRFDNATGRVALDADQEETVHEGDVLDELADATRSKGGDVVVVDADKMPSRSPVAAILRY